MTTMLTTTPISTRGPAPVHSVVRPPGPWRIAWLPTGSRAAESAAAYTVGLFGLGHPELLLFGADRDLAAALLGDLAQAVQDGANLLPRREILWSGWDRGLLTEQHPDPGFLVPEANLACGRRPDDSVPVLQLSYTDGNGRYPWESGYCGPRQPRPVNHP